MERPDPHEAVGVRSLLLCLAIWCLHAILLAAAFPLTELLTELPLIYIDSPFHLYQAEVAKELWETRTIVGYDPWFAAGHIGGVNYNASAKVPAIFATLFASTFSTVVAYKIYVFFCALAAPGFVLLSMRMLKSNEVTTISAMVLGVLLWWISGLRWYHSAGMVAFVASSYASLPYILLVWRSLTGLLSPASFLTICGVGAIGLLLHPLFPILVIFTAPFLLLATWKDVKLKALIVVVACVPALCLLPNIGWVIDSLQQSGWSDGSLSPYQKAVDIQIVLTEAIGRIDGSARGAKLYPVMWICAIWALSTSSEGGMRRVAVAFIGAVIALVVFSAVGAWWPVFGALQPNRLSAAAYLLLLVPAAIGIGNLFRFVGQPGMVKLAAGATKVILLASTVFFLLELKNEVSSTPTPHHGRAPPEVRGAGDLTLWLTNWIDRHTTSEARILFETSQGRIHDGAHIAGILARNTQREFIGGPYVFMHHAGFWDGYVFGKPIGDFPNLIFLEHLQLYNVGWIVVHSSASKAYLDSLEYVEEVAQHGLLKIYRVKQAPSYFTEGRGKVVDRKLNRIDLDEVEGDAVTLKYHFVDGLVAEPPVALLPVLLDGDPKPFIRILAPPRRLAILFR